MDVCSCSSNKCLYIYGGVLMQWLNLEEEMKEEYSEHLKVPYGEGYICLSQDEGVVFNKTAAALRQDFDTVVINDFERENPVVSRIVMRKPFNPKTLDPKSGHYDAGGIETIEILKAKLTKEQYKGYLLGNIIKYSTRANFKDQFNRDIEKINVYSVQLKQLNEEE